MKLDPQQVALLKFILQDVDCEAADAQIRAAVQGARAILADPAASAFDELADRTNPFDVVSAAVRGDAAARTSDNPIATALRELYDGGPLVIEDHDNAYHVLLRYADAGVLLGAAIMFELLRGAR
jgi:hypothetical protein